LYHTWQKNANSAGKSKNRIIRPGLILSYICIRKKTIDKICQVCYNSLRRVLKKYNIMSEVPPPSEATEAPEASEATYKAPELDRGPKTSGGNIAHGFLAEGFGESFKEQPKAMAAAIVAGAVGSKLCVFGPAGAGVHAIAGLGFAAYGAVKGYQRAGSKQESWDDVYKEAEDGVVAAERDLSSATKHKADLHESIENARTTLWSLIGVDGINVTVPDIGVDIQKGTSIDDALQHLDQEIAQCDVILKVAQQAQEKQEKANKELEEAYKARLDAWKIDVNPTVVTPAELEILAEPEHSATYDGAGNQTSPYQAAVAHKAAVPPVTKENIEGIAKRTEALNEANTRIKKAEKDRAAVEIWINTIINPRLNNTITVAQGLNTRYAGPGGLPNPPTANTVDRKVETWVTSGTPPAGATAPPPDAKIPAKPSDLGKVEIEIRDYSDVIEKAAQIKASAADTRGKLVTARAQEHTAQQGLKSTEESLVAAKAAVIRADEYRSEFFKSGEDPNNEDDVEVARKRYDKNQFKRKIAAAVGGAAAFFTGYFVFGGLVAGAAGEVYTAARASAIGAVAGHNRGRFCFVLNRHKDCCTIPFMARYARQYGKTRSPFAVHSR
jgi:hypothetical protein